MIAYRFHPGEKILRREEVAKPVPGPNDVVLKIRAAGVCHSDLHILDGGVPFLNSVFTMGHEACGEIEEAGAAVPDTYKKGRLYAVHGPNPCGNCRNCRTGRDHLCNSPTRQWIGLGADGAYAEYLKVPARNLVEVPAGVSAEAAAVATDAVLTPYHAIKTLANVRRDDTILLIGLGGLGINGVQVAKALGAHVIATDVRDSSLDLAKLVGADEVFHSGYLEEKLKGREIPVVVDFVGNEATFRQAESIVAPGGSVVLVGLGAAQVPLSPLVAAASEIRVQGSFWGTSVELAEVLHHIAAGHIHPQVERGALHDVNQWFEQLRQGKVRSRVALVPAAAEARNPNVA